MIHLIMNQPSLVPMHWPCKIRPGAHIVYASAELNKKNCVGISRRHVWYRVLNTCKVKYRLNSLSIYAFHC